MLADIGRAERPQNRIGQGMEGDIGVRMAGQGGVMGNLNAAEGHPVAFLEAVDVETAANADIVQSPQQRAFRPFEIRRVGDLEVRLTTGHHGHGQTRPFGDLGVIAQALCPGGPVGGQNFRVAEALRGLGPEDAGPLDGSADQAIAIDPFQAVGNRKCWNGAGLPLQRGQDIGDRRGIDEWPRRVVDQDLCWGRVRQAFKPSEHRVLPAPAAKHRIEKGEAGQGLVMALAVVRVNDDPDRVDPAVAEKGLGRTPEHGYAAKGQILLRRFGPKAAAAAGGDDECGCGHARFGSPLLPTDGSRYRGGRQRATSDRRLALPSRPSPSTVASIIRC